jgi:hypothetical protein
MVNADLGAVLGIGIQMEEIVPTASTFTNNRRSLRRNRGVNLRLLLTRGTT